MVCAGNDVREIILSPVIINVNERQCSYLVHRGKSINCSHGKECLPILIYGCD